MQLIEIVKEVLETGVLPMALERKMYRLLDAQVFDETHVAIIDQLIEALITGKVQPIA